MLQISIMLMMILQSSIYHAYEDVSYSIMLIEMFQMIHHA